MFDEKYVVFKREEFEKWLAGLQSAMVPKDLQDAVVIRTQDVFATQGLYAYSHLVQFALECTAVAGEQRDKLKEVRDYFQQRAMEAESKLGSRASKFPD